MGIPFSIAVQWSGCLSVESYGKVNNHQESTIERDFFFWNTITCFKTIQNSFSRDKVMDNSFIIFFTVSDVGWCVCFPCWIWCPQKNFMDLYEGIDAPKLSITVLYSFIFLAVYFSSWHFSLLKGNTSRVKLPLNISPNRPWSVILFTVMKSTWESLRKSSPDNDS